MKRAATFFAVALTVALLTGQAHAAGLCPVSEERYTYGPFDELRIDKVYKLSPSDDPADIPTDDFERDGYHYTLLCVVINDQSEAEGDDQTAVSNRGTLICTATFACRGEAKIRTTPSNELPERAGSFDLSPQIALSILFGVMGSIFGGKSIYQYIKFKKEGV